MSEPMRTTDEAITRLLARRAGGGVPVGLADDILRRLEMEPQARPWPRLRTPASSRALAWVAVAALLLVSVATAATLVTGSRPTPVASPLASLPAAAARVPVGEPVCLKKRPLPFNPSSVQLTGTWSDGGGVTYIRQVGNVVWIVGPGRTTGQRVFQGAIGSDLVIHLQWAEVGALTPGETRTPPWGSGTVDLRVTADQDGDVALTSIGQTGITQIYGPAYSTLTYMPCVPEQLTVPAPAH